MTAVPSLERFSRDIEERVFPLNKLIISFRNILKLYSNLLLWLTKHTYVIMYTSWLIYVAFRCSFFYDNLITLRTVGLQNGSWLLFLLYQHYDDVRMDAIASQITSFPIFYSIVYSDADQRKHQSSASLVFVRGIHRGPVNFPHKWPVTRKMFPFDDVIMNQQDIMDTC